MVPAQEKSRVFDVGDGLKLTVIGPDEERVRALQVEWDKQIRTAGVAKVAEFADQSVFNLSSITVLATFKKKTMLLTGDARGDFVLAGLKRAKFRIMAVTITWTRTFSARSPPTTTSFRETENTEIRKCPHFR